MTRTTKTHAQPSDCWSANVDSQLESILELCNVRLELVNPLAVRLRAVPLTKQFSKSRTNLLIQRADKQIRVYVDADLAYRGADRTIRSALNGPQDQAWRQLCIDVPLGDMGQVVRTTLQRMQSPIISLLKAQADEFYRADSDGGVLPPLSMLATETRPLEARELAESFQSSRCKPLARGIASLLTRDPPLGCIAWGSSGSGKDHLIRTVAHILLHAGQVSHVRFLSAPRLTCGRVFAAEQDRALTNLLDELCERPQVLLLVDSLDLGLSGTMASLRLLADGFDRGARVLATVEQPEFLSEIRKVPSVARRVHPICLPEANCDQTLSALRSWARHVDGDISPAALTAAIEITQRGGATQPAAALDLLRTALAAVGRRRQLTPDDVTSVIEADWP